MDNPAKIGVQINSTAGAIPMRNEKGEVSMQKVKVQRYVTGKRPDYAPDSDSDAASDEEFVTHQQQAPRAPAIQSVELTAQEKEDPRLRRLQQHKEEKEEDSDASDGAPRRRMHAAEVMSDSESESDADRPRRRRPSSDEQSSSSSDSEEELDDEEVLRKRQLLRERAIAKAKKEEELMEVEEEKKSEDEDEQEEESSEYEEYTDSEEETGPRLKPVFVRKEDRITVQEKEKQEAKKKQAEVEARKMAEERRRSTLKMVESEIRGESAAHQTETNAEDPTNVINTDDENDEAAYELWKLRELKRIKRDKEEREALEKERLESERLRNMTEDERRADARINPKTVTNKSVKGKYKFLQKYYHRGAFFMDKEENVYKRDFSGQTLEDKFDKTVLPKVMQVKNFGRSGRTKYTHLVDQDTTNFESPWTMETAQNAKFFNVQAGGVKQIFEKPSSKKKRNKI